MIILLCALLLFIGEGCSRAQKKVDYNVVLITMDTTRADHIDTGFKSCARAFTPALKRFAGKSIVFQQAYCTLPETLPSHLSMFTSHYPHELGVLSNQYIFDGRFKLLSEVLKEKGYYTAAFVSLGTLASKTGFARGFTDFHERTTSSETFFLPAETITKLGLKTLKKIKRSPFFLFLHYSDPHTPYAPPNVQGKFQIIIDGTVVQELNAHLGAILRKKFPLAPGIHEIKFKLGNYESDFSGFALRWLTFTRNCRTTFKNIAYSEAYYGGSHVMTGSEGTVQVRCSKPGVMRIGQIIPLVTMEAAIRYYRKEVEYMDQWIGKFLVELEKEELLDKTIVAITADHGEGLGERERYFGHVRYLNRQFIEVPMLVYLPGVSPRRVSIPVSLTGIAPTILEYMGIQAPGFSSQKSWIKYIDGKSQKITPVLSCVFDSSANADKLSVITWPYQCIFKKSGTGNPSKELYNLQLSQSYVRTDEIAADVLMRYSIKDYLFFQRTFNWMNESLKNIHLAELTTGRSEIEKLKTNGYLQ